MLSSKLGCYLRTSTNRAGTSARIRARARELGFHKVGITRAENLSMEQANLEAWLHRGFHGEMNWMARDPGQRADPRRLFS